MTNNRTCLTGGDSSGVDIKGWSTTEMDPLSFGSPDPERICLDTESETPFDPEMADRMEGTNTSSDRSPRGALRKRNKVRFPSNKDETTKEDSESHQQVQTRSRIRRLPIQCIDERKPADYEALSTLYVFDEECVQSFDNDSNQLWMDEDESKPEELESSEMSGAVQKKDGPVSRGCDSVLDVGCEGGEESPIQDDLSTKIEPAFAHDVSCTFLQSRKLVGCNAECSQKERKVLTRRNVSEQFGPSEKSGKGRDSPRIRIPHGNLRNEISSQAVIDNSHLQAPSSRTHHGDAKLQGISSPEMEQNRQQDGALQVKSQSTAAEPSPELCNVTQEELCPSRNQRRSTPSSSHHQRPIRTQKPRTMVRIIVPANKRVTYKHLLSKGGMMPSQEEAGDGCPIVYDKGRMPQRAGHAKNKNRVPLCLHPMHAVGSVK